MNCWQLLRQLQYVVRAAKWEDNATSVFASGSVLVTVGPEPDGVREQVMPVCLIAPMDAQADPSHRQEPGLVLQRIGVTLIMAVPGDRYGESALVGANRPDVNSSLGRGLLEIEERLLNAIRFLTESSGVTVTFAAASTAAAGMDPDLGYIVQREYTFEAHIAATRSYPAPWGLAAVRAGTTVTLTWNNPPDRYDLSDVVVVRKAGATGPADVTDGSTVAVADYTTETTADSVAAGTYSYGVFAAYDGWGTGDIEAYSEAPPAATVT